jgi:hypothetical protein
VRPLAERIAGGGVLDAALIGAAANSLKLEPEIWQYWASYEEVLTQFRRLWHVLVLGGDPASGIQGMPERNDPAVQGGLR